MNCYPACRRRMGRESDCFSTVAVHHAAVMYWNTCILFLTSLFFSIIPILWKKQNMKKGRLNCCAICRKYLLAARSIRWMRTMIQNVFSRWRRDMKMILSGESDVICVSVCVCPRRQERRRRESMIIFVPPFPSVPIRMPMC